MTRLGLRLSPVARRELRPTRPFHFDGTVWKPVHFPSKDQAYRHGVLWQTLRFGGRNYGVKLENRGTTNEPRIRLTIFGSREVKESVVANIVSEIRWRYDLDSCGAATFVGRYSNDRLLRPAIRRWYGMRPKSGYSLYEYLVITVLLQNTVVRRSVKMLQSLFENYGRLLDFDGQQLWAFGDPKAIEQATEKELRSLKLGYRARTLKRQAQQFVSKGIDEGKLRNLERVSLVKELHRIYGVGPQSAWYTLFEVFHDYDALDHISPWEGKIYSHILFGHWRATPKGMVNFLQRRYPGFRRLALHYLENDLFWRHKKRKIPWLARLIRL